jgi:hypothetical protein
MYQWQAKFRAAEIVRRAAEIRQNWSPRERARRTGLPPDMPERLRARLNGCSASSWPWDGLFELIESRLVPVSIPTMHHGRN